MKKEELESRLAEAEKKIEALREPGEPESDEITGRKQAQEQLKILSAVVEQSSNPVAVLTDNAIQHHGVLEPGTEFIEKPFSPAKLTRKIRDVLDGVE